MVEWNNKLNEWTNEWKMEEEEKNNRIFVFTFRVHFNQSKKIKANKICIEMYSFHLIWSDALSYEWIRHKLIERPESVYRKSKKLEFFLRGCEFKNACYAGWNNKGNTRSTTNLYTTANTQFIRNESTIVTYSIAIIWKVIQRLNRFNP